MDGCALSSKSVYQILIKKEIDSFHHVNTLKTSLTFIKNNALLSRGHVENNGLIQTIQSSDGIDKEYDIWDDVFLDGLDLHRHFCRNSPYGPIMFKIDLKILTLPDFQEIYITKDNPTNWKSKPSVHDCYYKDLSEFENDYRNSGKIKDGQIMFTFKSPGRNIKLNKFCNEIIVDDPNIFSSDKSLGILAKKKIIDELQINGLGHIPVSLRHSNEKWHSCWCFTNYSSMRFLNLDKMKLFFGTS